MKQNKLFPLIILSTGLFLQQASCAGACETEKRKEENVNPVQAERIHHPWFKLHWEKPVKPDASPPPRQKVDIFGDDPTFFVADDRVYFKPTNSSDTNKTY